MSSDPKAEVEISAHSRGLAAKLREARAKFGQFGAELKKNVFGKDFGSPKFFGKAGAQMLGNLGSSVVGGATSFLVDQAQDVMRFEDQLVRLQITADKTPEYMHAFAKSVRETSNETGLSADSILEASTAYVALTGDMDGAAASAKTWARVAQATGSAPADIAKAAASLKTVANIKPEEMEGVFAAMAIQGKEGAIELHDYAGQLANVLPMWMQFGKGGPNTSAVKEAGAAMQAIKHGFGGDAGETVTAQNDLLTSFRKNWKQFHHQGIEVFATDPKTGIKQLRNVLDIVRDIAKSKLAHNEPLLGKTLGGRNTAYRALVELLDGVTVKEGKALSFIDELIMKSNDTSVIGRDLETYMTSPAGKMAQAFTQVKNAIADAMTPERIAAFSKAVVSSVNFLIDAVTWVRELKDALENHEKYETNASANAIAAGYDGASAKEKRAASQKLRKEYADEGDVKVDPDASGIVAETQRAMQQGHDAKKLAADMLEQRAAREAGIRAPVFRQPIAGGVVEAVKAAQARDHEQAVKISESWAPVIRLLQSIAKTSQETAAHAAKGTKIQVDGKTVVHAYNGAKRGTRPGG